MKDYQFDIIAYLQDRGIDYLEEGANVTEGWIEVNCPFCGDDPSAHLGISPSNTISCWRCKTKGGVIKYVHEIENCSWGKAKKIMEEFADTSIDRIRIEEPTKIRTSKKTVMPEGIKPLSSIHYEYLESRGFDPIKIEKKYRLKALGKAMRGEDRKFQHRIIIPVFYNNIIVNFSARAFSENRTPRYIHQTNEKAIYAMKDCIYNIDSLRDIALIVEGFTDVWRMGDGAIAVMGTEFTTAQINLLLRKGVRKAYVMFDAEKTASKVSKKFAEILSGFIPTEILELDSGDPGELSQHEANKILRMIGMK